MHVDAYADIGGAYLAAELEVVSADHLQLHDRGGHASGGGGRSGRRGHARAGLCRAPPHPFDARVMLARV